MNDEHTLLLIIGKSASGKDSLTDLLCQRTGLKKLISYSTRPRRNGEKDTHIFVTDEEYQQMADNNQIAAYTEINNAKYWSTIEQLYESNIYICDYIGAQKLKELNLPNLRFVTVYIHIPDDVREQRAKQRGDDKTIFRKRCFSESTQFRDLERNVDYDYSIKNLNLPKAYTVLRYISLIEGVYQPDKLTDKENGKI